MTTDTTDIPDDVADDELDDDQVDETEDARARRVHEAQALRAKRREAEAARDAAVVERDTAVARVERLQRAAAERVAADVLHDPEDLWLIGKVELADLLDDEGDLDPSAVTAAAQAVIDQRGSRFGRPRGPGFDGGADRGARPSPPPASWSTVLTPDYRDAVAQGRR